MARYIDADKLVAWCAETYQAQSTTEGKAYVNAFLTTVDSCPTADVVEVVRCKDCKRFYRMETSPSYDGRCLGYGYLVEANHYCSYGERSENGT